MLQPEWPQTDSLVGSRDCVECYSQNGHRLTVLWGLGTVWNVTARMATD